MNPTFADAEIPVDASAADAARPWYLCLTKPRLETYALDHLTEQGFETYLPLLESWVRSQGDWQRKSTVMFPRYVFVRPAHAGQAIGPVRSTPGVTTLVRFGPVLACLPADRLAALRTLVAARAMAMPTSPLKVGQAVVFTAGPLKGASGIVSRVAAQRVQVLLSLLGQEHRVQAPAKDLVSA